MQFVDEAVIQVQAGDGGPGLVHFHIEPRVPKGGPDGGDGGAGGSVVAVAERNHGTLYDYRFKRRFQAESGKPGGSTHCAGKSGPDLELAFPLGTQLTDADTGEVVADLVEDGQRVVVCMGGRGGKGNAFFKSSTRRSPDYAQPGEPGQARTLNVELKLIADVGLIGLPNAGKSTLIRRISASKAQVGAYPFTTLTPNLGVARHRDHELVVADIPGLIEGASEGKGLGLRFLKHVQRAGLLVHLVSLEEDDQAVARHDAIVAELAAFDPDLPFREAAIALTKIDLVGGADAPEVKKLAKRLEKKARVFPLSGVTGEGVTALLDYLLFCRQSSGSDR
jgi:GTP-binding protein